MRPGGFSKTRSEDKSSQKAVNQRIRSCAVLPFTSLSEVHLLLTKEKIEGNEIKTLMEGTSQELHKGWVPTKRTLKPGPDPVGRIRRI